MADFGNDRGCEHSSRKSSSLFRLALIATPSSHSFSPCFKRVTGLMSVTRRLAVVESKPVQSGMPVANQWKRWRSPTGLRIARLAGWHPHLEDDERVNEHELDSTRAEGIPLRFWARAGALPSQAGLGGLVCGGDRSRRWKRAALTPMRELGGQYPPRGYRRIRIFLQRGDVRASVFDGGLQQGSA